jgi:hypothetical protein
MSWSALDRSRALNCRSYHQINGRDLLTISLMMTSLNKQRDADAQEHRISTPEEHRTSGFPPPFYTGSSVDSHGKDILNKFRIFFLPPKCCSLFNMLITVLDREALWSFLGRIPKVSRDTWKAPPDLWNSEYFMNHSVFMSHWVIPIRLGSL